MNRTSWNCVPDPFHRDSRVHSQLQGRVRCHRDRLDGGTVGAAGQVLCKTLMSTIGSREIETARATDGQH